MALVELWRADSWAPPLLGCGAEVLTLLRTDSEAAVAAGVPSSLPATQLQSCAGALAVLRGTASRTPQIPQSRLSTGSQDEAASSRSSSHAATGFAPPQRQLRPAAAVPLPAADRTTSVTGKVNTEASHELPPLTMDVGLLGEEPIFPQMWDDDALPEDTAWMFDPAADPLSEPNTVLDELAGPYGCGALCDPSDEPASPVSVFYADGSNSESCPSCDDDHEAIGDCQESAKPESSDVSGATAMDSGLDSSSRRLDDSAFGPTVAFISPVLDEEDSPAPPPIPSRKRARVVGSVPLESADHSVPLESADQGDSESEAPIRDTSSRTGKKARKAQTVKPNPKSVLAKGKGKGRQSCLQCFTFSTPQWREGPQGARTLCNACGVRYRKQLNLAKKAKGIK